MQHQEPKQPIRQATPSQAPPMSSDTERLAAFLRTEYTRLEPYRLVLAQMSRRCCDELRRHHHLPANPSDAMASAEDFLLALLYRPFVVLQEENLVSTMYAHLMSHFLEAEARRVTLAVGKRPEVKTAVDGLNAVDSVLVRATAVAADELRRLHGMDVRPADVLLAVNDALHRSVQRSTEGRHATNIN